MDSCCSMPWVRSPRTQVHTRTHTVHTYHFSHPGPHSPVWSSLDVTLATASAERGLLGCCPRWVGSGWEGSSDSERQWIQLTNHGRFLLGPEQWSRAGRAASSLWPLQVVGNAVFQAHASFFLQMVPTSKASLQKHSLWASLCLLLTRKGVEMLRDEGETEDVRSQ